MQSEEEHERGQISLTEVIKSLPVLEDDFYLSMQVMNLGIADEYIAALEKDLFGEYLQTDKTPIPEALLVSALSQMWIFAVYELFRTWRQRCREVLKFAQRLSRLDVHARNAELARKKKELEATSPHSLDRPGPLWRSLERLAIDNDFVDQIQKAYDSSERLFRKIEALRMHLAKHEMPKAPGSFAMAPGYARLDRLTGSLCWQILLQGNEVDIVSRREIADLCRQMAEDRSQFFLPLKMREKIRPIGYWAYGAKKVTLKLFDGTEYHGAIVLWDKEVAAVLGYEDVPFDARNVIDVVQERNSEME